MSAGRHDDCNCVIHCQPATIVVSYTHVLALEIKLGAEIPFSLKHFPEHDLIWIHHSGVVTRNELREIFEQVHGESARFRSGKLFTDLANVTFIEFGFNEIHYHAQRLQDLCRALGHCQCDSIHAPGSLVFGMARMYQQVIDPDGPLQVHVNEQRDLAIKALGLSDVPDELF